MKFSNPFKQAFRFLAVALLAGGCGLIAVNLKGADATSASGPVAGQETFASPEEAIDALRNDAAVHTTEAGLHKVFGPAAHDLLTGDPVQDAHNLSRFSAAMQEGVHQVKEGDDKITLEIGTNNWPMPIPLVKAGDRWFFDTAAGKEEIINRHIGKDELVAIGVCRAYVKAQQQYASQNPDAAGQPTYAEKFKSSAGKRDGLYWASEANEPQSPFGALVADAHAEGYLGHGRGRHAFHGYYFKILKCQGDAASGGKMDYVRHGHLSGGFALVAYPERWDQSGIMTFIVNQDGKVFQCNLGEKTRRIAGGMKEYNPTSDWTPVEDEGMADAVLEK